MREEQGSGMGIGAAMAVGCGVIMVLLMGLGFMMFRARSSTSQAVQQEMRAMEAQMQAEELMLHRAEEARVAELAATQKAEEAIEAAPGVHTGVRLTLVSEGVEDAVYIVREVDGSRVRLQRADDGEDGGVLWVNLDLVESWRIIE
jgi:hypothetical protein